MSPRIGRKVGPPQMKKNTAGESEGIAGQTRHIPGSAGRLHHPTQPEITMLLLFLIGAALSHARPEPPPDDGLPTGPLRFHRERWRSRPGLSAFWR